METILGIIEIPPRNLPQLHRASFKVYEDDLKKFMDSVLANDHSGAFKDSIRYFETNSAQAHSYITPPAAQDPVVPAGTERSATPTMIAKISKMLDRIELVHSPAPI